MDIRHGHLTTGESNGMSTYWEKQEYLKELVKKFDASKYRYRVDGTIKRYPPKPPMSPFSNKPEK